MSKAKSIRFSKKYVHAALVAILDALIIVACGAFALWVRFDFSASAIPSKYVKAWAAYIPWQILITWAVFLLLRMYRFLWRSLSAADSVRMMGAILAAFVVNTAVSWYAGYRLPRAVYLILLCVSVFALLFMRFSVRFWLIIKTHLEKNAHRSHERVMLIGAGDAARTLLREMQRSALARGRVVCAIDDNTQKHGKYIEGVPIIGGRDAILKAAERYRVSQIIFAIPTATEEARREILSLCGKTGCKTLKIPGIYQLVNGEVTVDSLKEIEMEDLLGRPSIRLNLDNLREFIADRVVLVTGGGGSIGSELCRQIAGYHPAKLIILDIYENNAYEIQQELIRKYHDRLNLVTEIASVRDRAKMERLFRKHRPDLVFHAAAHKHVPLMQFCPDEAVKNNIFGTYNTATLAEKYGVQKFVLISSDKAVNPTNFMGATKRFCEMILQSRKRGGTEFCAVRFGNVLGSNGSVIPLFRRQIAEGGPVTITDKRIIRYFMTIPEAVQLVLEAGAMAHDNEIFVLDMGQPVKILDLAENLIRLSGKVPYKDIKIKEIGLRPGEKLYEELLMRSNDLTATSNKKIFVEHQPQIGEAELEGWLAELHKAVDDGISTEDMIQLLMRIVPTYVTPEEVNDKCGSEVKTETKPV